MKKITLSLLSIALLSATNVYAADTSESADATKTAEGLSLNKDPEKFDENNHYSFHLVELEKLGDKQADKIAKNYHKSLLKSLKNTDKNINKNIQNISSDIDKNIEQGLAAQEKTQLTYDENCSSPKTEEEHAQCQNLKENIFNIEEQVKGIKNEKENIIGQLEIERKNRHNKSYTQYKNLIGKLKAQVEAQKQ